MNDIECPYCGHDNEPDGEQHEQDVLHEMQCSGCEKYFGYTIGYIPVYNSRPMPCANDGEHSWKPIIGAPKECFKNKYRCEHCDEKKTIAPPVNNLLNE